MNYIIGQQTYKKDQYASPSNTPNTTVVNAGRV